MEALAILAVLLIILPLPLCIYLMVQRSKDLKRIQKLEEKVLAHRVSQSAETPPPVVTLPQSQATEPSSQPRPLAQEASIETAPPHPTPAKPKIIFYNEEEGPQRDSPLIAKDTPSPKSSGTSGFIALLRSFGIWPPKESSSAEAGLMQWWLPRIGGLLATLSVISFAVYISQGTPPWVRFIELLVADGIALAAGFYFLKKRPKFGSTVMSTALSMVYLTSIAAYAAPQVRVIENPFMGITIQFAVVAAIFFASMHLQNRSIAILALAYGFASSLFSSYVGLLEPSLISALALYVVGIAFSRKFDWFPILSLSTIGVYLPVLSFCALYAIGSTTITLPHFWSVIAYLLISVSLLPFCDFRWNLTKLFPRLSVLHAVNTTACLAIGYLYMSSFNIELVLFYGSAAIVFAGWAVLFGSRDLNSYLFQLFFLKAGALAALWLVNRYEGDIRWFALIIEAVLICWVAARSKSRLQEAACVLLWLVSMSYAADSIGIDKLEIGAFSWFLFLIHPAIAAGFLSYLHQTRISDGRRSPFFWIAAIANGIAGITFVTQSDVTRDALPLVAVLYGSVLCTIGLIPKFSKSIPAISGALVILAANIQFWDQPDNEWSFVAVVAITLGLAYLVPKANAGSIRKRIHAIELVFHFAWITTIFAYTADAFQPYSFFPYFGAAFTLFLLAVPTGRFRALRDASFIPLLLFSLSDFSYNLSSLGFVTAIVAYLTVLFLPNLRPQFVSSFRILRHWRIWRTLHHCLVAFITARFVFEIDSWIIRVLAMLLLSGAFHFLWRIHKRYVALLFSLLFIGLSLASIVSVWDSSMESVLQNLPWAKELLVGGLLTVLLGLAMGIDHAKGGHRKLSSGMKQALVYLAAIFSYTVYATTLSSDLLWVESSFTPLMALFCLILVAVGIGAKIKPYRLVAIIGLTLPLFRLFVYDIRDTLIRIIAFAVLAVLFIFVGYLYHRFQSRIE